MEKIVYCATLPVVYTGGVECTHKIGAFADEIDAIMCSKIVENILAERSDMVESADFYSISMKRVDDNSPIKVYNNVDEFVANNTHTKRYAKDKGYDALNALVNQTLEFENGLSK